MNTGKLRVAVFGAGVMGRHHARIVANSERAELAYVVEPQKNVGMQTAEAHGATWLPEFPGPADIDAAIVATPTEFHFDVAMTVLGQGIPLLIEKPVVDNMQQTEEILALAAQRGVPLMCGLLERYNPAVITATAILDGPLHIIAKRHSPYASRIHTGVSWDLLIHDVDLSIRLMDALPTGIDARLGYLHPDSRTGSEDVAEATLEFEGTKLAQISASRVGQRKVRSFSIYEAHRLLEVDLLRRDVTIYRHVSESSVDGGARGYRQQTVIEIPELQTSTEPLAAQFEAFVDIVRGKRDADEEREGILRSHRVVDQIVARGTGH